MPDSAGNRSKLTYPDGTYITHTFDAVNRLDQIKNATGQVMADYAYDGLRGKAQLDLENGTKKIFFKPWTKPEDFKQFYMPAWKRMLVWFISAAIALFSLQPLDCYFG